MNCKNLSDGNKDVNSHQSNTRSYFNIVFDEGLSKEGHSFLEKEPIELLLKKMEQMLFIQNFIKKGIEEIKKKLLVKEKYLERFLNDKQLFEELYESNQLDIKSKI